MVYGQDRGLDLFLGAADIEVVADAEVVYDAGRAHPDPGALAQGIVTIENGPYAGLDRGVDGGRIVLEKPRQFSRRVRQDEFNEPGVARVIQQRVRQGQVAEQAHQLIIGGRDFEKVISVMAPEQPEEEAVGGFQQVPVTGVTGVERREPVLDDGQIADAVPGSRSIKRLQHDIASAKRIQHDEYLRQDEAMIVGGVVEMLVLHELVQRVDHGLIDVGREVNVVVVPVVVVRGPEEVVEGQQIRGVRAVVRRAQRGSGLHDVNHGLVAKRGTAEVCGTVEQGGDACLVGQRPEVRQQRGAGADVGLSWFARPVVGGRHGRGVEGAVEAGQRGQARNGRGNGGARADSGDGRVDGRRGAGGRW